MSNEIEHRLDRIDRRLDEIKDLICHLDETMKNVLTNHAEERILSPKEVAEMLGMEIEELYRWCRNGKIPNFKLGKHYKFKKTEILDWIKNRAKDEVGSIDDYVNKYLQRRPMKG